MAIGRFPVEAGQVLQFARSVGDANPIFTDPAVAAAEGLDGIPAPPTFVQASAHFDPEYALRPHPDRPWFGSGGSATGYGPDDEDTAGGMLHGEQHFVYHRPLLVGDVLTASVRDGNTWTKQGRRGGELRFFETITDYRDEADELVVTARVVGVSTQHQPQEDWPMTDQLSTVVAVGDTFTRVLVEDLTRTQIVQYAGASGDFNALHTDATYATQVAGFPGVFAHGMLTMGMTGRVLTDVFGPHRLRAYGGRFVTQVWPGDSLTVTAMVTEFLEEDGERRARVGVETVRQDGSPVFVGEGTVAI